MRSNDAPWRAEFNQQLTPTTIGGARQHAQSLLRQIEQRAGIRLERSAEDFVHAALTATLVGSVSWDPQRMDLAQHLAGAIASVVSHDLRRARRFPHVSIDDDDGNGRGEDFEREVAEAMATGRSELPSAEPPALAALLAELRRAAARDVAVLEILDLFARGITERHRILLITGMSPQTYHAARQRLIRLAQHVPSHLRNAALHAVA